MARLVATIDGKRQEYELRQAVTIGRSSKCAIRLPLGKISREHARILQQGGKYRLEDLASSNGTFVNGARIEACDLNDGDRVRVGTAEFQFVGTEDDPLLGTALGDYQILERIGRGGMGTVYRARQISLDRMVALKVMRSELAARPGFVEDFTREARLAGQLRHAGLIAIHDFGRIGERAFFSMEYIAGQSLLERLERDRFLPPAEIVEIAIQVAEALAYAHERSVLHQDIKPDNLLLDAEGRVKIADLGLAKVIRRGQPEEPDRPLMGTPQYVAPEIIRRLPPDPRSDLYSLGATLFHLAVGSPPYGGESATAIVQNHLNAPVPDPRSVRSELPDALAEIILKCMAKDPARRFASMRELREALVAARPAVVSKAGKKEASSHRTPPPSADGGSKTEELPAANPWRPVARLVLILASIGVAAVVAFVVSALLKRDDGPARLFVEAQRAVESGDKARARRLLHELRDLHPGSEEAKQAEETLRSLETPARTPASRDLPPVPPAPAAAVAPAEPVAPAGPAEPPAGEDAIAKRDRERKADREWEEAIPLVEKSARAKNWAEARALLEGFLRKHPDTSAAREVQTRLAALNQTATEAGRQQLREAKTAQEAGRLGEAGRLFAEAASRLAGTPAGEEAAAAAAEIQRAARETFFRLWSSIRQGLPGLETGALRAEADAAARSLSGLGWGAAAADWAAIAAGADVFRARLRMAIGGVGKDCGVTGLGMARVTIGAGGVLLAAGQPCSWDRIPLEDLVAIAPPGHLNDAERIGGALHAVSRGHFGYARFWITGMADKDLGARILGQAVALRDGRAQVERFSFRGGQSRWRTLVGEWMLQDGRFATEEAEQAAVELADRRFEAKDLAIVATLRPGAGGRASLVLHQDDTRWIALRHAGAEAILDYSAGAEAPTSARTPLPAPDARLTLDIREGAAVLRIDGKEGARLDLPGCADWQPGLRLEASGPAASFGEITIEQGP